MAPAPQPAARPAPVDGYSPAKVQESHRKALEAMKRLTESSKASAPKPVANVPKPGAPAPTTQAPRAVVRELTPPGARSSAPATRTVNLKPTRTIEIPKTGPAAGKAMGLAGKVARGAGVVGAVMVVAQAGMEVKKTIEDKTLTKKEKTTRVGGSVGRAAGSLAGGAAGAKVGALGGAVIAGPPGALAGGIVGGVVGAVIGAVVGEEAGKKVGDKVS